MNVMRTTLACALVLLAALGVAQSAAASGSWRELHRPLNLPKLAAGEPCPVSAVDQRVNWTSANIFGGSGIGRGPVYPALGYADPIGNFSATRPFEGGFVGKLFWYAKPSYRGRVLIRGRRLDGSGSVGFAKGRKRKPELRMKPNVTNEWDGQPPGSRGEPSQAVVPAAGCYGVQIDGTTFSRTAVFTASTD